MHNPVIEILLDRCQKNKNHLSFKDFMEIALYAPEHGYYQRETTILGQQGDYITAPTLTPLFGKTLAKQCIEMIEQYGQFSILEIGGGNGMLAEVLLESLLAVGVKPEKYIFVETSLPFTKQQQNRLKKYAHQCKLEWHTNIPSEPFQGIILGNELLDALPVHKVRLDATPQEWYVAFENNTLHWQLGELSNERLQTYLAHFPQDLHFPYDTEINIIQEGILKNCYNILERGFVLFIDYGFTDQEFYHPDRSMGTLMGHYKHKAYTCPLQNIGLMDITAHVNFSKLAQDAYEVGFEITGFTTQAHFLLSLDCLDGYVANIRENVKIQTLLSPHEMGELFKVIALSKNDSRSLLGFQTKDFSYKL